MAAYCLKDLICIYVLATPCTTQPDCAPDGDPPDNVYVCKTYLPDSEKTFQFMGYCYDIDPTGAMVALPSGAYVARPTEFSDDCNACKTSAESNNCGGSGGNSGGGAGGGGTGGGGGDGWWNGGDDGGWVYGGGWGPGGGGDNDPCAKPGATCTYIPGVLCATSRDTTNAPKVWMYKESAPVGAATSVIVRYLTWCYSFDLSGAGGTPADGDEILPYQNQFSTCDDCQDGAQATLCNAGDEGSAPNLWVRKADMPPAGTTWYDTFEGYCFSISGDATLSEIPADAVIGKLSDTYDACSDCRSGIKGVSCSGNANAPEIWMENPESDGGTLYYNYHGHCYSFDQSATPATIPPGKIVVDPTDSCLASCEQCLCGPMDDPCCGVRATRCENSGGPYAGSVFVRCDNLPDNVEIWKDESGSCWSIDPNGKQEQVPKGAAFLNPKDQYHDCVDCVTDGHQISPPGSGGGIGGGNGGGTNRCVYTLDGYSGTYAACNASGRFKIKCDVKCRWSAFAQESWIHVSNWFGQGTQWINFTLDENDGDERTGTIVTPGGVYTITQSSSATTLTISPPDLYFTYDGGTTTATLTTGCAWEVEASSVPAWVTISPTSGTGDPTYTITVTVAAENGDNKVPRTATIKFVCSDGTCGVAKLNIHQIQGCPDDGAPDVSCNDTYTVSYSINAGELCTDASTGAFSVTKTSDGWANFPVATSKGSITCEAEEGLIVWLLEIDVANNNISCTIEPLGEIPYKTCPTGTYSLFQTDPLTGDIIKNIGSAVVS